MKEVIAGNWIQECWLQPPATGLYTIATAHTIHHKLHCNITKEIQNIYFIHTEDRKLTIANINIHVLYIDINNSVNPLCNPKILFIKNTLPPKNGSSK